MSSFISYAQNFEDVMLWRALSQVDHGFYIDIGAQDPVVDSISLLFYEHGWRGIHVEPTPYYAGLLRESRTSDVVIQAAVCLESHKLLQFFEIPNSGISTADAEIAKRHRTQGFEVREIRVPCVSLATIFEMVQGRDVHWLKIDVEGFEYQVLSGWGSANIRPWIVVVESTLPLTRIESHQQWEPLLLGYGYAPAYFDGLNRFYISTDHPELRSAFSLPPNVFDDFVFGTTNGPFHRLTVSRHQKELKVAREAMQAAEAKRVTDAANHSDRIEQLESELRRLQEESVSHANEVIGLTLQHQVQIQAAHVSAESVRAEAAKAALSDSARIQELEGALHRLREELASRANEVIGLISQHQVELQAAHAVIETVRAEAARGAADDSTRIKELESDLGRQREELTLRAHEITVDLHIQRTALEATVRASHEKELLVREQGELLRASANREQLILTQFGRVQGQLTEAQRHARDVNTRLLEHQDRARREIEALAEQHDAATRANREQEQSNRHQAELLREAASCEHALREQVALLLREATEQEARVRKQSECLLQELRAEREQLTRLKSSPSWRLTAPLRLFAPRSRAARTDSIADNPWPPDVRSRSSDECDIATLGVPGSMSPQMVEKPPISAAVDINALLALQHEDFVDCAYRTIFNRPADSGGLAHYTGRVLAGDSKMEILQDLCVSEEAMASGVNPPWLVKAIARHQARNRPLRRLIRRLFGFGSVRAELADWMRISEEKMSYFERRFGDRIDSLDQRLSDLEHGSAERARVLEERLNEMERRTAIPRVQADLSSDQGRARAVDTGSTYGTAFLGRSLVTKRILRDMSSAIRDANTGPGMRS